MFHQRSPYLPCACDTGEFPRCIVVWANQHGRYERHFCPNCPACADVKKNALGEVISHRPYYEPHGLDERTSPRGVFSVDYSHDTGWHITQFDNLPESLITPMYRHKVMLTASAKELLKNKPFMRITLYGRLNDLLMQQYEARGESNECSQL